MVVFVASLLTPYTSCLQDNEGFLVVPRDVSVSVYGTTATATLVEYFTPRSSPASSRKTTVYNTR